MGEEEAVVGDAYEPDSLPSLAKSIPTNGITQSRTLAISDTDWIFFPALPGFDYVIETTGEADTRLALYGKDTLTLLSTDDNSGSGQNARINWQADAGGVYHFRVNHGTSSAPAAYGLSVTGNLATDGYEPDSTPTLAKAIAVNGALQSKTLAAGEADWASFSTIVGLTYVLETSGETDTYLELYASNGTTLLTSNDNDGPKEGARIEWQAPSSGTYLVKVRGASPSTTGSYALSVTGGLLADTYEPDGLRSLAKNLAVNGSIQNRTLTANDTDWVSVLAEAGFAYVFETSGSTDTHLALYSIDSTTLLATADDGGSGNNGRIAWSASSTGTYLLRIRGSGASPAGLYSLSATGTLAGDAFEADNSYATAKVITANVSGSTHTLTASDVDWVSFTAQAGMTYVFETTGNTNTYVELYGTNGTVLLASDDNSGDEENARLEWLAPSTGTYAFRVVGATTSSIGFYTLSLTSFLAADSYESDNSFSGANAVAVNGASQARTLTASDVDWALFTAQTGVTYTVETSGSVDTYVEIYGTNGTVLLASGDGGGSGSNARVAWQAVSDGSYAIRVRSLSSSTGHYGLTIASSGGAITADTYESDGTSGTAKAITANSSAQSRTLTAGDVDWVSFTVQAGLTYTLETTGGTDTYLEFYGTDMTTLLASNDNGGTNSNGKISWPASSTGTYYLKIRGVSGSTIGSYQLSVLGAMPADAYETDNAYTSAKPILVNGSAQDRTLAAADLDWVSFTAQPGYQYIIGTSGGTDTYLELYGTNGTTLLASADTGGSGTNARLVWTASSTGTYYFKVRGATTSVFGSYSVSITGALSSDTYEPDGAFGVAKTITVNGTAQQRTLLAGDEDWASFAAQAGLTYVVETSGGTDTYLDLYGTNGTTLLVSADNGGSEGSNARVSWQVSTTGTYFVKARGATTSTAGLYSLQITAQAAWLTQGSGTTQRLNSVSFVDENTGWVAGAAGTILKSSNGGVTWVAQSSGAGSDLNSVHFFDANTGWAVGNSGTYRRTTNGGATWSTLSSGSTAHLQSVTFTDANTGWIAGGSGTILVTTNGGTSWTAQTSGAGNNLNFIYFQNATTGWAVGNNGTVRKTTNAGATWSTITTGSSANLYGITFSDANTGWIAGAGSAIRKTTNGGTTWTTQESGTTQNMFSVDFVNARTGWAVGTSGTILKHQSP